MVVQTTRGGRRKDEDEDSLGSNTAEGNVLGLLYYEGGSSADSSDEGASENQPTAAPISMIKVSTGPQ